jgi:hypothetical protein
MTLRFIAYPDVFCSTACQPNAGAGMATFEPAYPQTSTQIQGVTLTADRVWWCNFQGFKVLTQNPSSQ